MPKFCMANFLETWTGEDRNVGLEYFTVDDWKTE